MSYLTVHAHFDGERIQLDEKVKLSPNAKLLVTVLPTEEEDREFWARLGAYGLSLAYGEDEPEYPLDRIKELNPRYEGW